jgi:hypothetical protein
MTSANNARFITNLTGIANVQPHRGRQTATLTYPTVQPNPNLSARTADNRTLTNGHVIFNIDPLPDTFDIKGHIVCDANIASNMDPFRTTNNEMFTK